MKRAYLAASLSLLILSPIGAHGADAGSAAATMPSPTADAALETVAALARINGQALACQDSTATRRAKALMLVHAPRTARFGAVYEEGTQQAFLAAAQAGQACAEPSRRAQDLELVARQLQAVLPAEVK